MKQWIEETTGSYVLNIKIGNNEKIDTILMPLDDQVGYVRDAIFNDPNLKQGYIFVGYSNGAYLGRMMLEQFQPNNNEWQMVRFVGLHGPLGGFFCGTESQCYHIDIGDKLSNLAADIIYTDLIQNTIAEAQYWRDPYNLDRYYEGCQGLPYLDNIHQEAYNQTYKKNFMSVDYHILFGGPNDGAIAPWISSFYGTWANNSDSQTIDLTQRDVYIHDTFGLKTMYENDKIILVQDDMEHTDIPKNYEYIVNQVCPYLIKEME